MPDALWWIAALFAIVGVAMVIAAGAALRREGARCA